MAEGIDPGHTRFASGGTLEGPPLRERFALTLGTISVQPLVAGDTIFVSALEPGRATPTLYALDAQTGATRWFRALPTTMRLAYDGGMLYGYSGGVGVVQAFDAATGATRWVRELPDSFSGSAPVARDGLVYVSSYWSGGSTYALDGDTGATVWTGAATYGGGTPAVDEQLAIVHHDYDCSAAAYDRR